MVIMLLRAVCVHVAKVHVVKAKKIVIQQSRIRLAADIVLVGFSVSNIDLANLEDEALERVVVSGLDVNGDNLACDILFAFVFNILTLL